MKSVVNNYRDRIRRYYLKVKRRGTRQTKYIRKTIGRSITKQRENLQKDQKKLRFLSILATVLFVSMVTVFLIVLIIFALISRELPNPNQLLERSFELSTRFYDRNGELLFETYGDKNRTLVQLDNISPYVVQATLAVEDSAFYSHKGYSIRGVLRAAKNMIEGKGVQSGSTLTQQVIKNTLLTPEQTISRKLKEIVLALQLENRYSKNEILQMYLNETPYGGMNYGIYSASKAYFNKEPKDLTIEEAAYLAGLPQSPSYYSQFGSNPEAGIERKNYVLYLMNERGWLDESVKRHYLNDDEYERVKEAPLNFEAAKTPLIAPHFIFYTKQLLSEMFGEEAVENGGLQVTTTLDLKIHELAQRTVTDEIEKSEELLNVWNGSMIVLDPKTGYILSMVGSKGYNLSPEPENCISGGTGEKGCKFDPYVNVTTALRQPGSAIKPITYATMLNQGYSAAYPLLDVPTRFPGAAVDKPYIPENYDGIFRGVMPLRKSLGNSLNIPAVKALAIVGIDNMIDMAEKMGISTFKDRERYGLALTLGGGEVKLLELTGAYSVFTSKGVFHPPTSIIEVKNSKGEIIYKHQSPDIRVLGEDVAFLISDILSDDGARSDAFGLGTLLHIPGYEVAVKTGTTDDKRDNYAIGFTPSIVAGVWVGNNNNEKMNPYVASGITGATPIWNTFMATYLKEMVENAAEDTFEPPENVNKLEVDKLTGGLPYGDSEKRYEWFIKDTEPTAISGWYQHLEICKKDGRLANSECRKADETDEKTYIKIQAELPQWQTYVDAWVKENYDDDKYFPPQMESRLEFDGDEVENKDKVFIEITGFEDGDEVSLEFRLSAEVSGYYDIAEIRIYMDDNKVAEDSSEPYGYNFELDSSQMGKHKFKVVVEDEKGHKDDDEVELVVAGYL
ncbi:penicillin-binding protein [Patescibacteria group bacterium]|nr:penicillin-binding protein [Patescibacteria group bacterium]